MNGRLPDLLGRLGGTGHVLDQQLGQLARAPLAALKNLGVAYGAALTEANKYTKTVADARVSLPPFGANPLAKAALQSLQPVVGSTYHQPVEPLHASASDPFRALLDPKTAKAAKLGRLLQSSARVRAQFEKVAGAKVATDGRADGTVSMLPSTGKGTGVNASAMTSPGSASGMSQPPSRQDVYALLAAMDAVVMEQARAVEASQAQQGTGASSLIGLGASGLTTSSYYTRDEEEEDEDGEHEVKRSALMSLDVNPSLQSKIDNPTGQATSADTGALQLKRLMDKRDQMYDLYRQSMDKYSQSAQKAIDAMRG